jgi:molecular chaperone GrpE
MTTPLDSDESTQPPASEEGSVDDVPVAETDPLAELLSEKDALQDRLLRTVAEFDNYRKRIERDPRDQANALVADAIEELLPIIDNLERALEAPIGSDTAVFRAGVELIHRQMTELLRQRGVKPIQAAGTDFDPRFHQAMAQEVSAEHREGEVMEELRKGYTLGERLLRPAMVKVAKA